MTHLDMVRATDAAASSGSYEMREMADMLRERGVTDFHGMLWPTPSAQVAA